MSRHLHSTQSIRRRGILRRVGPPQLAASDVRWKRWWRWKRGRGWADCISWKAWLAFLRAFHPRKGQVRQQLASKRNFWQRQNGFLKPRLFTRFFLQQKWSEHQRSRMIREQQRLDLSRPPVDSDLETSHKIIYIYIYTQKCLIEGHRRTSKTLVRN